MPVHCCASTWAICLRGGLHTRLISSTRSQTSPPQKFQAPISINKTASGLPRVPGPRSSTPSIASRFGPSSQRDPTARPPADARLLSPAPTRRRSHITLSRD
ncbi:hypothetical protein BU16DRAFT_195017 [Lophium mytilinum]|uniref:Uncharacterized protein n=1 Tax=Lophium mytilinum TaxID=390894 RepID=A0A6A6RA30_9PEZI|nr:hypothetical protein BU16DRAFT_195017 [Lophium mytilinum]